MLLLLQRLLLLAARVRQKLLLHHLLLLLLQLLCRHHPLLPLPLKLMLAGDPALLWRQEVRLRDGGERGLPAVVPPVADRVCGMASGCTVGILMLRDVLGALLLLSLLRSLLMLPLVHVRLTNVLVLRGADLLLRILLQVILMKIRRCSMWLPLFSWQVAGLHLLLPLCSGVDLLCFEQ